MSVYYQHSCCTVHSFYFSDYSSDSTTRTGYYIYIYYSTGEYPTVATRTGYYIYIYYSTGEYPTVATSDKSEQCRK